jgi:hypothetical protein
LLALLTFERGVPMKRILAFLLMLSPFLGFAADINCTDLSMLQRAAGYVSWLGFIEVLGIGAIAGGLIFIFGGIVKTILKMTGLMEILLWLLTVGCIAHSYAIGGAYQSWTIAIGAILIPCAYILSAYVHKIVINESASLAILSIIWGFIALFFSSSFVGFLAVGALLGTLGFFIAVTPFSYMFGFKSDEAIPHATAAGLIIMGIYILTRALHINEQYFAVFETGALWLGSLVGFLGLLIVSSAMYDEERTWGAMNLLTIILLIVTVSLGLLFAINEVTTIASAFLLLYLAAKIIEVETESMIALGVKLFIAGIMIACVWQWLSTHQDIAKQYLTISIVQ